MVIPRFLPELLEQDEYWRGADGRPYRVEAMDQKYRLNLLAYLRRNAARIHEHCTLHVIYGAVWPDDDAASFAVNLPVPIERSRAWLDERPLVHRLVVLIARHDALDGEVVDDVYRELDAARPALEGETYDQLEP